MIYVKISNGGDQEANKVVKDWRRADWERMRREMERTVLKRELRGLSANEMWTRFKTKVRATVKKNVPMRTVSNKGRPQWMSRGILAAVRQKKRLWRTVKGGVITEEYRKLDKRVKNMIRSAKRKMEKKLADGGGNKKSFFAYIKRKTKSRTSVGPLKDKEQ